MCVSECGYIYPRGSIHLVYVHTECGEVTVCQVWSSGAALLSWRAHKSRQGPCENSNSGIVHPSEPHTHSHFQTTLG